MQDNLISDLDGIFWVDSGRVESTPVTCGRVPDDPDPEYGLIRGSPDHKIAVLPDCVYILTKCHVWI